MDLFKVALGFLGFGLLGGCGLIHSVERERPAPVVVPDKFSGGSEAEAQDKQDEGWWKRFGDSQLDALMSRAFEDNLDLKRAYARLDQAYAIADGAEAGWWPQINASVDASYGRQVFNRGALVDSQMDPDMPVDPNMMPMTIESGQISFNQASYSLSLAASYEIDLWGRVHSQVSAAELDLGAAQDDVEALSMTVSAQVAELWFSILTEREAKKLLLEQLESNRTFLELVELRFGQGLASALDVFQQRQQVAATKAQLPTIESRLAVLSNQLAVLLGKAPGQGGLSKEGGLPKLPELPKVGVPADLLMRRPDVRSAHKRVLAADYRIGAAIAARFPTISLSASTGFRSFDIAELFKSWIWNLTAGIVAPLIDGGRRAAEVDRSKAVLEDQLAAYGQVVLGALREVEDALVQEQKQQIFIVELDQQLELSRSTLSEARSRYINGLSDYLPVLTSLRALQGVEQQHLQARRQLLSFRIQLCRALGGAWVEKIDRPKKVTEPT